MYSFKDCLPGTQSTVISHGHPDTAHLNIPLPCVRTNLRNTTVSELTSDTDITSYMAWRKAGIRIKYLWSFVLFFKVETLRLMSVVEYVFDDT